MSTVANLSGRELWPNHPLTFARGLEQLECPGCGGHITPREMVQVEDQGASEIKEGYHLRFDCSTCYAAPVLGIVTLLGDTWVGWVKWDDPREEEFAQRATVLDMCHDLARRPVIE